MTKSQGSRGFFGIGCYHMKNNLNYGTLFRTAQVFGADFIFLIGKRFKIQSSDTMKSWRHLPLYQYSDIEDFNSHRPFGCCLVGIELLETSTPLSTFHHPERACYLLGAEDSGLPDSAIKTCQAVVRIPGSRSLNVSTAGSIVLYDRITKLKDSIS